MTSLETAILISYSTGLLNIIRYSLVPYLRHVSL